MKQNGILSGYIFSIFFKIGRIPSKVKALMIVVNKKGKLPKIPETVVDLYISFLFSARKARSNTLEPGYIPNSVKRLIIRGYAPENKTLDIGVIPKGVEVLSIDCDGFRDLKILPESIPDTVKVIKFGDQIVLSGEDGIIPLSAQKEFQKVA